MPRQSIRSQAGDILNRARARKITIATAESCTGGMIAAALTAVAGSSDVFDRGFVTYSNPAKEKMLGVPSETLAAHGAVSAEVAQAMALGALKASGAGLAVAVTGIAGPGGGSDAKPVGLVFLAAASRDGQVQWIEKRFGSIGRAKIRQETVRSAFDLCLALLEAGTVQQA